jgi:hypothetical protein
MTMIPKDFQKQSELLARQCKRAALAKHRRYRHGGNGNGTENRDSLLLSFYFCQSSYRILKCPLTKVSTYEEKGL